MLLLIQKQASLILQYFFLSNEINNFLASIGKIEFAGNITISLALFYFFLQASRLIAKSVFERDGTRLPTTKLLFYKNIEYTKQHKEMIYAKIERIFKIKIPSEKEQLENEYDSKKRIAEAMSLVKKKFDSLMQVRQHNIEYGFWRNLSGGSITAIIFASVDSYLAYSQQNKPAFMLSAFIFLLFFIIIALSKFTVEKTGNLFAKTLIEEFLSSEK